VHPLWFYKHQHDNRVCSKLFVACQRWWFQWRFWFLPSVPGYTRTLSLETVHTNFEMNCQMVVVSRIWCGIAPGQLYPNNHFEYSVFQKNAIINPYTNNKPVHSNFCRSKTWKTTARDRGKITAFEGTSTWRSEPKHLNEWDRITTAQQKQARTSLWTAHRFICHLNEWMEMTLRISYEIHTASTDNKERPPQKFTDIFRMDKSVNGPTSRQLGVYLSERRTKIFRQKSYSVKFSITAFISFACPFLFPQLTPMIQRV